MKLLLSSSAVISAFGINAQNFDYLDINKVKAGISFNGTIHYNPANTYPSYEVPKGSRRHTSSETSLWIGGIDNSIQLMLAGKLIRNLQKITGLDL